MKANKLKVLALLFVALLCCVGVSPAYAAKDSVQVLDYRPTANPVADRTVHLNVNKLNTDTHEYVVGSVLQIIDKETGKVVMQWTTGEQGYESERELDIKRTYILHEVSAPEGYALAEDVEFVLSSVNFETKGEVLSGAETADGKTNAEFANVSGDIETQAFVISLYDQQLTTEETITEHQERKTDREVENSDKETTSTSRTVTRYHDRYIVRSSEDETEDEDSITNKRTSNTSNSSSSHTTSVNSNSEESVTYTSSARRGTEGLTHTGDETSNVPIVVALVAGIAIIAVGIVRRRK